jgi:hypothetical protein
MIETVGTAGRTPANGQAMAVCEVCRVLDHDYSTKPCRWCNQCGVWICAKDWRDLGRRFLAATYKRMGM